MSDLNVSKIACGRIPLKLCDHFRVSIDGKGDPVRRGERHRLCVKSDIGTEVREAGVLWCSVDQEVDVAPVIVGVHQQSIIGEVALAVKSEGCTSEAYIERTLTEAIYQMRHCRARFAALENRRPAKSDQCALDAIRREGPKPGRDLRTIGFTLLCRQFSPDLIRFSVLHDVVSCSMFNRLSPLSLPTDI